MKPQDRAGDSKSQGASPSAFIKFTLLNLILLAAEFGDRNFVLVSADEPETEAAIQLTRFQVPTQARVNDIRRLSCQYKLHGATLHALKLFKDEQEFYRFAQKNQKMSFPVPGVQVDLGRSREGDVWLKMTRNSDGLYKCQVLIEGTFKSVSMAKRLEVKEAAGLARPISAGASNQSGPWQQSPVQQRHLYNLGVSSPAQAHSRPSPSFGWLLTAAAVLSVGSLARGSAAFRLAAGRPREEIERWRRKSRPSAK